MAKLKKTIIVFRHGETDWNRAGRIQGHLDVPLNERGRNQARALGDLIRKMGIEAFLSSDLSRAYETATLAMEAAGVSLPLHKDQRLREIHLGRLQGKTREEIEIEIGVELSDRLRHSPLSDADVALLQSESGDQVFRRALASLADFARSNPYDRIGVATHGGVIRRLIQYGQPDSGFPPPVPNGVIYTFELASEGKSIKFMDRNIWPHFASES